MNANPTMAQFGQIVDAATQRVVDAMLEVSGKNFSKTVDVYTYPVSFAAVANGASPSTAIQINAGSTFVWVASAASVRNTTLGIPALAYQGAMTGGSNVPSWPFRLSIIDGGDNDQLQSAPIHLGAMFGDVATVGPIPLLRPRLWAPNSSVQVQISRFAAGQVDQAGVAVNQTMDVDLNFIGYRIKIANMQNLTSAYGS